MGRAKLCGSMCGLTLAAVFTLEARAAGGSCSAAGRCAASWSIPPASLAALRATAAAPLVLMGQTQDPPDGGGDREEAGRWDWRRRLERRAEGEDRGLGAARPRRQGPPLNLTPQQIERLMNFLKENLPELHQRLEELGGQDEEALRRRVHRIAPRIIEMARTKHEDPPLGELMIEEFRLDTDIFELVRRYRAATDASFKNQARQQLEALVAKQFEVHHARQVMQLERLEGRLAAQRQRLQEENDNRDRIIARRLNRVLEGLPPPPAEPEPPAGEPPED